MLVVIHIYHIGFLMYSNEVRSLHDLTKPPNAVKATLYFSIITMLDILVATYCIISRNYSHGQASLVKKQNLEQVDLRVALRRHCNREFDDGYSRHWATVVSLHPLHLLMCQEVQT